MCRVLGTTRLLRQAKTPRALGCEQAQGYLFGAPTPARGASDRLDAEGRRGLFCKAK